MKLIWVVGLAVALALSAPKGSAWGRDGHQVTANLAQSRLSPAAGTGVAVPAYRRPVVQRCA